MGKLFIDSNSLTSVADSIRTKTGKTKPITFPDGFKTEIDNISGGSIIPVVASYNDLANIPNPQMYDNALIYANYADDEATGENAEGSAIICAPEVHFTTAVTDTKTYYYADKEVEPTIYIKVSVSKAEIKVSAVGNCIEWWEGYPPVVTYRGGDGIDYYNTEETSHSLYQPYIVAKNAKLKFRPKVTIGGVTYEQTFNEELSRILYPCKTIVVAIYDGTIWRCYDMLDFAIANGNLLF